MRKNPLLSDWNTAFGVPPFDKIESEDYLPAIKSALAKQQENIQHIIENEEPPNFVNTIEALELSVGDLDKIRRAFFAVNHSHSNEVLQQTNKELAPKLAAHQDRIYLNAPLFEKVEAVYKLKNSSNLSLEELRLLEETYKKFVRSGIALEEKSQKRLREINALLASLSQQFGDNLLKEISAFEFHISDEKDVEGLPDNLLVAAKAEAQKRGHENGWSFTLQRSSFTPFLQNCSNREARQQLFERYAAQGSKENNQVLQQMVALRCEKAQLLGHKTYSDFVLTESMAKTAKAVFDFMDELWPLALEMAKDERTLLAAKMRKEGIEEAFRGGDWLYYMDQIRKERCAYDESEVRPYFELTTMRNGIFTISNKLFGLNFKELPDLPRWHKDQQAFEVLEADGSHLGVIYMDFFARDSKRGGAWMNSLMPQSTVNGMVDPVVCINMNCAPPSRNSPCLLSFDETETLFHEFGHALHGLFSKVKYRSLSGTSVPRDFVEFPSQIMENWINEPTVLKLLAKHYQTAESISDELIGKIKNANSFGRGFAIVEFMAAAYLDMEWHCLENGEVENVETFEQELMQRLGLIDEILPRYKSSYFSHIFAGGYSAGYYSYLWAEVLDSDAFQAFKDSGNLFDQETAKGYRKVLSQGGTRDGMDMYVEFRGREPILAPFLEKKGLNYQQAD